MKMIKNRINRFLREAQIPKHQTYGEEIANGVTHGIGTAFSAIGLTILIIFAARQENPLKIVSFTIYGISLISLYLSSTLYHSFVNLKIKNIFRLLDHSAIYLLIAGTYTPITLIAMSGTWGWTLFILVWGLAISGIVITAFFLDRFKVFLVASYVIMGCLIVVAIKPLIEMAPKGLVMWLITGGIFYLSGLVFYLWRKLPYQHPIWHLFVLAGSISHFLGIIFYLI
jgi:hemolysin III